MRNNNMTKILEISTGYQVQNIEFSYYIIIRYQKERKQEKAMSKTGL